MSDDNKFDELRKKYDLKFNNKILSNIDDFETISNYNNEKVKKDIFILEKKYVEKKNYLNQLKNNIDNGNTEKIKKTLENESTNIENNLAKIISISNSMYDVVDEIEKQEINIIKNTSDIKDIIESEKTKEIIHNIKTLKDKIDNLKVFF